MFKTKISQIQAFTKKQKRYDKQGIANEFILYVFCYLLNFDSAITLITIKSFKSIYQQTCEIFFYCFDCSPIQISKITLSLLTKSNRSVFVCNITLFSTYTINIDCNTDTTGVLLFYYSSKYDLFSLAH